jgi:hypothetical protein
VKGTIANFGLSGICLPIFTPTAGTGCKFKNVSRDYWFRKSTWSAEAQADFASHLSRSRGPTRRAQYLRIQARHLADVGTLSLCEAALDLLDQLLREYPEVTELSAAHELRAECLARLGQGEEALCAYKAALEAERQFPYASGLAYLGFVELVLTLNRADLFSEALSILAEFGGHELLPIHVHRFGSALALLYDSIGEGRKAGRFARLAIAAASQTKSGLQYHPDLGLVGSIDPAHQSRLWELGKQ